MNTFNPLAGLFFPFSGDLPPLPVLLDDPPPVLRALVRAISSRGSHGDCVQRQSAPFLPSRCIVQAFSLVLPLSFEMSLLEINRSLDVRLLPGESSTTLLGLPFTPSTGSNSSCPFFLFRPRDEGMVALHSVVVPYVVLKFS